MKKKEKLRRLKKLLEKIKEYTDTGNVYSAQDCQCACESVHNDVSKALEELFPLPFGLTREKQKKVVVNVTENKVTM